jgi:hypothetical protein
MLRTDSFLYTRDAVLIRICSKLACFKISGLDTMSRVFIIYRYGALNFIWQYYSESFYVVILDYELCAVAFRANYSIQLCFLRAY